MLKFIFHIVSWYVVSWSDWKHRQWLLSQDTMIFIMLPVPQKRLMLFMSHILKLSVAHHMPSQNKPQYVFLKDFPDILFYPWRKLEKFLHLRCQESGRRGFPVILVPSIMHLHPYICIRVGTPRFCSCAKRRYRLDPASQIKFSGSCVDRDVNFRSLYLCPFTYIQYIVTPIFLKRLCFTLTIAIIR